MLTRPKRAGRHSRVLSGWIPAALAAFVTAAATAPVTAPAAPRDPAVPVWKRVGPGVMHGHWVRPEGPWNINALTVNLDDPHIRIESEPGGDRLFAGETVPATAKRESRPGHTVVAAINADFWSSAQRLYTPMGLTVANGYLARLPAKRSGFAMVEGKRTVMGQVPVHTRVATTAGALDFARLNDPATTLGATLFTPPYGTKVERLPVPAVAVALDGDGFLPNRPATGRVTARAAAGADIALATATVVIAAPMAELVAAGLDAVGTSVTLTADAPAAPGVITAAVGGMPEILRGGETIDRLKRDGADKSFSTTRHPRTAVGLTSGGRTLVMVTVDGRQPGFSAGQSLPELTRTMRELGCTDAVNLDGGGSTCMVVRDEVVNRPSDATGPRKVADSLLVVSTAPVGEVAELRIEPDFAGLDVPNNAPVILKVSGFDAQANPVELNPAKVEWTSTIDRMKIDPNQNSTLTTVTMVERANVGLLKVSVGPSAQTTMSIRAAPVVDLDVSPDPLILSLGETIRIKVTPKCGCGYPLVFQGEMMQVEDSSGMLKRDGESLRGAKIGSGLIDFSVAFAHRKVAVHVDRYTSVSLEGFEGYPTTGPATSKNMVTTATSVASVADSREGTANLRVDYAMAKRGGRSELTIPIDRPVTTAPAKFALSIFGDGHEAWVRGTLADAKGRKFTVDFTDAAAGVRWTGEWRRKEARLEALSPAGETPAGARPEFPARFVSLTVSQEQEALKASGTLRFDSLEAVYPPEWTPPAPPDSTPPKTGLDIAPALSHTPRP